MEPRFRDLCEGLGVKPQEMLRAIEKTFRLPYAYARRLERGESPTSVLNDLFAVAELGHIVDENVKDLIGLRGFVFEDGDVDIFENYFFLAYAAKGGLNTDLITYYMIIDKGSAKIILSLSADRRRVDRVEKALEELFIDAEDLAFEYEDGRLSVYVELEGLADLPRLEDIRGALKGLLNI